MRDKASRLLKEMLGPEAVFREGQWECIESVLNLQKTLVVQRTGWGKSIIYFIATKLLREQGKGPILLVSPLLSLMRNQIESAERIGIKAKTINSDNTEEWLRIEESLANGNCDILLLSPERLGNQDFVQRVLPLIRGGIGMFVVDEAHCISDWGHDFRSDYRRIVRIINGLPPGVPVLATTATANERVVQDIKEQLGDELIISRGPLTRESLKLQVIKLKDQAERLAWLYENISQIDGSGIIYCLTTADCNKVAKWLREKGITALEYHASLSEDAEERKRLREEREKMLVKNEVKALVATIALGMGFDKPDLAFVIHYQRPGSLVEYYQQIGRAGRALENAYAVLLNGEEDDEIKEYFINRAFPTEQEMRRVVDVLEQADNGMKMNDILKELNITYGRLDKCLKLLQIDGVITYEHSVYSRTVNPWKCDMERGNRVTKQRYIELEAIRDFVDTEDCYMKYIANKLDDPYAEDCQKCSNCTKEKFFNDEVKSENVVDAVRFLRGEFLEIKPRKMWPAGVVAATGKRIPDVEQNKYGKTLCSYGDAGWGKLVRADKYDNNYFRDELVDAAVDLIRNNWEIDCTPGWITSVPSLRRPELVKSFAQRVAGKIGLPYIEVIEKTKDTPQQKFMQNSFQQSNNVLEGFAVNIECPHEPVILIDDMVDSGWTFAVCGALLKRAGSGDVIPFALASTSKLEGGE